MPSEEATALPWNFILEKKMELTVTEKEKIKNHQTKEKLKILTLICVKSVRS